MLVGEKIKENLLEKSELKRALGRPNDAVRLILKCEKKKEANSSQQFIN
jgi:hypothetical protein